MYNTWSKATYIECILKISLVGDHVQRAYCRLFAKLQVKTAHFHFWLMNIKFHGAPGQQN